jgi:putative restriction endonuclease
MRLYLAVTDSQWFRYLSQLEPPAEDINFWQPRGTQGFKVLPVGGPFLFKLKAPDNAIGGVGWFSSYTRLPLNMAWEVFQERNGCAHFSEFRDKIQNYRRRFGDTSINPEIGCIILTDPVFFQPEDWIELPPNWKQNIVQGKSYDTSTAIGKEMWSKVTYKLQKYRWFERPVEEKSQLVREPVEAEYKEVLARVRVGQGTFRTLITDAYQRRCSITGEKTLPALEAAHIKPYAHSGPHRTSNGLLLRSDMHRLYDSGYLTVTKDYRVEVSRRIKEEFENGKEYYQFHGKPLLILPSQLSDRPEAQYIEWHNEQVYAG